MKIDLHVHTMFSYDSDLDPRHMVRRARQIGLDAVCVTEHNTFDQSAPVLDAAAEIDFPVFRGAELSTTVGHILVFGVDSDCWKTPYGRSRITPEAVVQLLEAVGGAGIIAHPFKPGYQFYARELAEHPRICAMEVCNGQCLDDQNRQAGMLAQSLGLPGTGGSDAHSLHEIGRCYTELAVQVSNEKELIAALLSGKLQARRSDYRGL